MDKFKAFLIECSHWSQERLLHLRDRSLGLRDRLERGMHLYNPRSQRIFRSLIGLVVVGVGLQLLPSVADNPVTVPFNNQSIESDSTTIFPLNIGGINNSTAAALSSDTPVVFANPQVTYLDSGTVVLTQPKVTGENFIFKAPQVVHVDPRATRINLPQFYGGGKTTVELCLATSLPQITLNAFGSVTPVYQHTENIFKTETGSVTVVAAPVSIPAEVGNATNKLILTGTLDNLLKTINSGNGLLVTALNGELNGGVISVSVIPVSEPTTAPAFCNAVQQGTYNAQIQLQPLGLEFTNSMGGINLHKK